MKRIWDKQELYDLHCTQGKPLREMASIYGVSHETIRTQLVKLGITITRFHKRRWDYDEIFKLYHTEKNTLQEIGDLKGVTREAVRQQMVKLGIPTTKCRKQRHPHKPKVWDSLDSYIASHPKLSLSRIPPYLLPTELECIDCHNTRHLRIYPLVHPATNQDDTVILCASCLGTRYKKGMTWARQIDLYRDMLLGASGKCLAKKYNISLPMVYKIIYKLKNGLRTTRKS